MSEMCTGALVQRMSAYMHLACLSVFNVGPELDIVVSVSGHDSTACATCVLGVRIVRPDPLSTSVPDQGHCSWPYVSSASFSSV